MKKLFKKIKKLDKQIAECLVAIDNMENHNSKIFPHTSEDIIELAGFKERVKHLKNEKLVQLSRLEDAISDERKKIITDVKAA
ncbi:hypothetical protein [Flavobacterium coralii]|uniref:hypothetical protein n=1 Tax=Flavobacterium coralii TaxID=2838017 RepID=UPI000C638B57|nr:hypothetical protein [Flavobacterium sp.]|tara:strand:+ start:327 stop:575 length:249 start_codon:yes stop_codon:yes gene_type:complete